MTATEPTGNAPILIRPARAAEAGAGLDVLRRSITDLCSADHRGDPAEIAGWLANKTPAAWTLWAGHPAAALLVAERGGILAGVGMVRADGEILLNYVAPEARFRGVSRALLWAMEAEAARRGAVTARLESTATARRFYIASGYAPAGGRDPMRLEKRLP